MPQLDLFHAIAAHQISWTYRIDPLRPEKRPDLIVIASMGSGQVWDSGMIRPPSNVRHEAVDEALSATWSAYLFGEQGDMRQALRSVVKKWEAESAHRKDG